MCKTLTIVLVFLALLAKAQVLDYPRDVFNTSGTVTGTKPFPSYDPIRLAQLSSKQHEIELQIFDTINEAALRHDKKFRTTLDVYGNSLGLIPGLAIAHYKWVFGDKPQLDWLLAEDRKGGWGCDSLTITVFAYMDEWDKTIRALKQRDTYLRKGEGGATGEILENAIRIRKRLYGAERFDKAWKAAKIE